MNSQIFSGRIGYGGRTLLKTRQSQRQRIVSQPYGPGISGARSIRSFSNRFKSKLERHEGRTESVAWQWEESGDCQRTYAVLLFTLFLGTTPILQEHEFGDLPYFISLAIITMYIGAHRSLNARVRQPISLQQGLIAPLGASAAIFGVYLLVTYFPDLSFQTVLDAYFWILAFVATIGAFTGPLRTWGRNIGFPSTNVDVPEWMDLRDGEGTRVQNLDVFLTDAVVLCLALFLATADLNSHHANWTINNLIACLVASDVLQLLGLSSFRVAAVLLFGMLIYDVTWVFASPSIIGENVMLRVATSDLFVGPTRLLFPRVPGSMGEASSFPFSLLGLGDIAVPGLLACLALRFDASRTLDMRGRGIAAAEAIQDAISLLEPNATGNEIAEATGKAAEAAYDSIADMEFEQQERSQGRGSAQDTVFSTSDAVLHNRKYFTVVIISYILGISMAFAANAITGLGQPALLYLVPTCMLGVVFTAVQRKDFSLLWQYRDTTKVARRKIE